ncbi:MAG: flagellar biosynthesis anti-sigma factor FlgM [Selenomonadaceae bacterium]|nr:flagellar biosynthesis anti-sigma factor FlgM [Selenomonadaceae bacterium]
MIINKVNSAANYYSNVTATRYTNAAAVRGTQKFEAFTPSREAQSFSAMLKELKGTSEVREDKVNDLKQRISSGQYFVSADNIALSLLTNRY